MAKVKDTRGAKGGKRVTDVMVCETIMETITSKYSIDDKIKSLKLKKFAVTKQVEERLRSITINDILFMFAARDAVRVVSDNSIDSFIKTTQQTMVSQHIQAG